MRNLGLVGQVPVEPHEDVRPVRFGRGDRLAAIVDEAAVGHHSVQVLGRDSEPGEQVITQGGFRGGARGAQPRGVEAEALRQG